MHESITIRQVGPLRDVHIDHIPPITLLIGASASGKSTLLKVLILMRYVYKMLNIRAYLKASKISRSPFRLRIDSLLSDELKDALNPQSEIIYRVSFSGKGGTTQDYEISYTGQGRNFGSTPHEYKQKSLGRCAPRLHHVSRPPRPRFYFEKCALS